MFACSAELQNIVLILYALRFWYYMGLVCMVWIITPQMHSKSVHFPLCPVPSIVQYRCWLGQNQISTSLYCSLNKTFLFPSVNL